jgi:hypothetical protein
MNFGQFLSNAGATATSMRAAEESERVARENQLKIEEQNRQLHSKPRWRQMLLDKDLKYLPLSSDNFRPCFI